MYNPAVSANRHESIAMNLRVRSVVRRALLIGFGVTVRFARLRGVTSYTRTNALSQGRNGFPCPFRS